MILYTPEEVAEIDDARAALNLKPLTGRGRWRRVDIFVTPPNGATYHAASTYEPPNLDAARMMYATTTGRAPATVSAHFAKQRSRP